MTFSFAQIITITIGYLLLLVFIAWLAESGKLSKKLTQHPAIITLSMGVYASAWAVYGSLGYAQHYGFGFLAYFLGFSGLFFLSGLLLVPLQRLIAAHQLNSLADLIAFRYRSPAAGSITALFMLIATVPLLSLQFKALTEALQLITDSAESIVFWFCGLLMLSTILLGTRNVSVRDKHEGLVVAMAAETIIKLIAFGAIAIIGVKQVFGGFPELHQWLNNNPQEIADLYTPLEDGVWHTMILAFFVAALLMPHTFQMSFIENPHPKTLLTASWGVPLFMLLLALCVPLILFAGNALGSDTPAAYYSMIIGAEGGTIGAILAYIVGISSVSGILIVASIALASMLLNHWVIPARSDRLDQRLYGWLSWARRLLIVGVLAISYAIFLLTQEQNSLLELAVVSFIATLQFTPGLLATLFWEDGNRLGYFAGLAVGFSILTIALFIPIFLPNANNFELFRWVTLNHADPVGQWHKIATITVIANSLVFGFISIITPMSHKEKSAAEVCAVNSLKRSFRQALEANDAAEMQFALSKSLGEIVAKREMQLALDDLGINLKENRPYALRRLRDQLETNLSGLLGPSVAHELIEQRLPYKAEQQRQSNEDFQFTETRIELYRDRLSGLAAELDNLRRFHRQTLMELPMGVVSLGSDGEIIGWNHAMETLTGVTAKYTIGSRLTALPNPWQTLLYHFATGEETRLHQAEVKLDDDIKRFNLHRSALSHAIPNENSKGLVIVVEDATEIYHLEAQLNHSERLASIGRLAAGVAHEIGNPVTAIACLAQNLQHEDTLNEMQLSAEQIITQTERINRIVESLVTFSHGGTAAQPMQSPVNIRDTAQEAIDLIQLNPERAGYAFINNCTPDIVVNGDSQRLLQVFINLLNNAADATDINDPIRVISESSEDTTYIYIEDLGHGIPQKMLDVLFEPFVTSKSVGSGTGLGLALVYSIIEDHFGSITADSPIEGDRGTRFTITLPLFQETSI